VSVELRAALAASGDTDATPLPTVQWQPPPAPAEYVVEIGRLFDGVRADYRRHVDLHVRDGRIVAIVSRGVLPARGPVIDARDATVIPGFVDLHAHQTALVGERLGRAWLAYGVTTVREVAADVPEALERGEAWRWPIARPAFTDHACNRHGSNADAALDPRLPRDRQRFQHSLFGRRGVFRPRAGEPPSAAHRRPPTSSTSRPGSEPTKMA
jgi:hypothetical protein